MWFGSSHDQQTDGGPSLCGGPIQLTQHDVPEQEELHTAQWDEIQRHHPAQRNTYSRCCCGWLHDQHNSIVCVRQHSSIAQAKILKIVPNFRLFTFIMLLVVVFTHSLSQKYPKFGMLHRNRIYSIYEDEEKKIGMSFSSPPISPVMQSQVKFILTCVAFSRNFTRVKFQHPSPTTCFGKSRKKGFMVNSPHDLHQSIISTDVSGVPRKRSSEKKPDTSLNLC